MRDKDGLINALKIFMIEIEFMLTAVVRKYTRLALVNF